jgi:hypothetical protein
MKTIKTLKAAIILALTPFIMIGCASAPGLGSYGPGSDTVILNGNRGRAGAQISKAQADQYTTQRKQTIEELELERLKRQSGLQQVNDYLGMGQRFLNFGSQFIR